MHTPQSPLDTVIRALVVAVLALFSVSAVSLAYEAGRHANASTESRAAHIAASRFSEALG